MSDLHSQSLPPPSHASPAVTSGALSSPQSGNRPPILPDLSGEPPVAPPRTSSAHRNHEKVPGSRRKKSRGDERGTSHPEKKGDDSRSRRHAAQAPEDSSRATRGTNTHDQGPSEPGSLMKESSTVINAVMVSDPAVDVERERARASGKSTSPPAESGPAAGLALVGSDGVDDGGRGGLRSRHDYTEHTVKRKETTFGQYILGQTLGEGEFGKVKLGWKRDGTSIQVAIKLIRRETLGSNPSRLPKIYREIAILRDLAHPNIVRLHEMVETDRHIGIIMEYASGGELFDYILNNRYLKDNSARRLFAQLVSGVGYLHKKGIVHRDLKLENLLLDRNRNIIITDFGFANTFDPFDELGDEIEYNLTNKDYVKRMRLDKINTKGVRRGDLMQTSCGSPCYAAPELVVSDSLYTGRKVDVWSCGVILYAMLAGYLPFDDDPANPDGDNINLLYKYIVTTPLTFPEYVTPHARDLLRRILVPDPRKRADLFEVARHSWLSEYSHIVSHITSSTTQVSDIANTTVPQEKPREAPSLARSASVKEPPKSHQSTIPSVGALLHQSGDISQDHSSDRSKTSRDTKRRTVQVEYVAPQSQTTRGEAPTDLKIVSPPQAGPVEVAPPRVRSNSQDAAPSLPYGIVPQDASMEQPKRKAPAGAMPSRPPGGHLPRSTSESTPLTATATGPPTSHPARPPTGGSMTSFNGGRLPSRGSYGLPVAPTVAQTNAEGRLAQPKSKQYQISAPIPQDQSIGRPSAQPLPPRFNATPQQEPPKGHKRSNTVSGISEKLFMRTGSIFGGRGGQSNSRQKTKRPPPTSMREPYGGDDSRMSVDSRRSMYGRKTSEAGSDSRPRRFSLLPPSFSLKGLSSSRSQTPDEDPHAEQPPDHRLQQPPSTGAIRPRARATSYATPDAMSSSPEGAPADEVVDQDEPLNDPSRIEQHISELHGMPSSTYQPTYNSASAEQVYPNHEHDHYYRHRYANHSTPSYYDDYNGPGPYSATPRQSTQTGRSGRGSGVLHKNHRKFADAYEYERDLSHQPGSSGAARKVMDFFRRRAKSRVGDDR
ncbi:putative serine/threonine protein kinase (Kin4) [Aspergillus candidus]|uniref:non-specific serine/threonine protein kinase n=1 Tax=Aspergillus candidus TaxID=41067 RepID=A0A2I2FH24_ASPCN|nr:serine/threonine protein kinase [Aspergillus candidus]PLB39936.1 serine/threonine protein kinase [Aspergillus candidus]